MDSSDRTSSPVPNGTTNFNDLLLLSTGLVAVDFSTKREKMIHRTYRYFMLTMFYIHTLLIMHKAVLDFGKAFADHNNVPLMSFTLSFALTAGSGVVKIRIFEFRHTAFSGLLNRLRGNVYVQWIGEQEWEKKLREKSAWILKVMCIFIYTGATTGLIITMYIPFLRDSHIRFCLPFPFPETADGPYYVPVYILQCIALTTFISFFVVTDMIFVELMMNCCDNLRVIERSLKTYKIKSPDYSKYIVDYSEFELTECESDGAAVRGKSRYGVFMGRKLSEREETEDEVARLIKNCIAHHQAVSDEVKIIDEIYKVPLSINMVLGPVLVGFMAYVILSDMNFKEIAIQQGIYSMAAAFLLFTYCYFCSLLLKKYRDLGFAFYSFPWYETDLKTQKLIATALLRLGTSRRVTAGIVDVALTTFLSLVKFSYNWVTLLRSTGSTRVQHT